MDDQALTEAGGRFEGPGAKRLVIGCGALARDILALRAQLGEDAFALRCLPALLHNRPQKIPGAVRAAIRAARADGFESVWIAYGDCGSAGGLDAVCAEEGVERIAGPHCFSFLSVNADFAARAGDEIGVFYLTDFLARQFDALVWRGLGLDRHPDLRDQYFGNYQRVAYLAQTENPDLTAAARVAAARLGLAFERRVVRYGDLEPFLRRAAGGDPVFRSGA